VKCERAFSENISTEIHVKTLLGEGKIVLTVIRSKSHSFNIHTKLRR